MAGLSIKPSLSWGQPHLQRSVYFMTTINNKQLMKSFISPQWILPHSDRCPTNSTCHICWTRLQLDITCMVIWVKQFLLWAWASESESHIKLPRMLSRTHIMMKFIRVKIKTIDWMKTYMDMADTENITNNILNFKGHKEILPYFQTTKHFICPLQQLNSYSHTNCVLAILQTIQAVLQYSLLAPHWSARLLWNGNFF